MSLSQDDQRQQRPRLQPQQLQDKRPNPQANQQRDGQMIPPGGVPLPLNVLPTGPIMDLGSSPPPVASITGNNHKTGTMVGNGNSIKGMGTNPVQNNMGSQQLPTGSMHMQQQQQQLPSSSTVTPPMTMGPPPPSSAATSSITNKRQHSKMDPQESTSKIDEMDESLGERESLQMRTQRDLLPPSLTGASHMNNTNSNTGSEIRRAASPSITHSQSMSQHSLTQSYQQQQSTTKRARKPRTSKAKQSAVSKPSPKRKGASTPRSNQNSSMSNLKSNASPLQSQSQGPSLAQLQQQSRGQLKQQHQHHHQQQQQKQQQQQPVSVTPPLSANPTPPPVTSLNYIPAQHSAQHPSLLPTTGNTPSTTNSSAQSPPCTPHSASVGMPYNSISNKTNSLIDSKNLANGTQSKRSTVTATTSTGESGSAVNGASSSVTGNTSAPGGARQSTKKTVRDKHARLKKKLKCFPQEQLIETIINAVKSEHISEKIVLSCMPKLNIEHIMDDYKEFFEAVTKGLSLLEEDRPLNCNDMNTSLNTNNNADTDGNIQLSKAVKPKDEPRDENTLRHSWSHMSNDEIISSSSNDPMKSHSSNIKKEGEIERRLQKEENISLSAKNLQGRQDFPKEENDENDKDVSAISKPDDTLVHRPNRSDFPNKGKGITAFRKIMNKYKAGFLQLGKMLLDAAMWTDLIRFCVEVTEIHSRLQPFTDDQCEKSRSLVNDKLDHFMKKAAEGISKLKTSALNGMSIDEFESLVSDCTAFPECATSLRLAAEKERKLQPEGESMKDDVTQRCNTDGTASGGFQHTAHDDHEGGTTMGSSAATTVMTTVAQQNNNNSINNNNLNDENVKNEDIPLSKVSNGFQTFMGAAGRTSSNKKVGNDLTKCTSNDPSAAMKADEGRGGRSAMEGPCGPNMVNNDNNNNNNNNTKVPSTVEQVMSGMEDDSLNERSMMSDDDFMGSRFGADGLSMDMGDDYNNPMMSSSTTNNLLIN